MTDVNVIEAKIPSQATAQNQLADKDFVNSSISTATADFKGTVNSVAALDNLTANNNDYAFVVTTDQAGNIVYKRYKYNGTTWLFEYDLNNSSFTAAQWATINSGVTSQILENVAYIGEDGGEAVIPEFDPQTDTLLKTTQSLTNTEKETVIGNILDKNYNAGSYIGKGKKHLKLNVGAPVATDFDGFVDGATTEQSSLAEVPDNIYFDRTKNRFIASKDAGLLMKYYMSWQDGDAYMNPNNGVYFKNGNDYYQWNGTTLVAATVGNVNKLTQADFNTENTIYVIRYDFDLCGQSITIPENCVLEFDGGTIDNGTIVGKSTMLNGNIYIPNSLNLTGVFKLNYVDVDWFINSRQYGLNCYQPIQKALDFAANCFCPVRLGNRYNNITGYHVLGTTRLTCACSIIGNNASIQFISEEGGIDFVNYGTNTFVKDITFGGKGIDHENAVVTVTGRNSFTMDNCTIQYGGKGLYLPNTWNFRLTNSHVLRSRIGVVMNNCVNCTFVNNGLGLSDSVTDKWSCGIYVNRTGTHEGNTTQGIIISNNIITDYKEGIYLDYCDAIYIQNNIIDLIKEICIHLTQTRATNIRGNYFGLSGGNFVIKSNFTEDHPYNKSQQTVISENHMVGYNFINSNGRFISITDTVTQYLISGNDFLSPSTATSIPYCLIAYNGKNKLLVINNTSNSSQRLCDSTDIIANNNINCGSNDSYTTMLAGGTDVIITNIDSNNAIDRGNSPYNKIQFAAPGGYGKIWGYQKNPRVDMTWKALGTVEAYSGFKKQGTTAERPGPNVGACYFDTDLGKPIWGNGTAWVDATNVRAGTHTSGTFVYKPTVATNNIPVGFKYFCTDKQTTEGATDGIEIIHKGNDVWVDALGRTIS